MTPLAATDQLFFERHDQVLDQDAATPHRGGGVARQRRWRAVPGIPRKRANQSGRRPHSRAGFDTTLGFGLRAVAGEATGFAHAAELSEPALAPRGRQRVGDRVGPFRRDGRAAARRPTRGSIPTPTLWDRRDSPRAPRAGGNRRLRARQGSRALCRSWPRSPASGRRCKSCAATAPGSPICARWCG